ncbi:uncharacterized protein [Asterias amurensis]|uniref:uncharacterized protein isoform X2 n=1 Tax=Asterias amurensis TaxID=7602 RepID=UPI003AB41F36
MAKREHTKRNSARLRLHKSSSVYRPILKDMEVVLFCLITLPLPMVVVWCASISTVDVTNDKVELWQSGNDERQEQRSVGRRRTKRNVDNTPSYKDALFTSPNTAYFQKNQTQYLRCPTWRLGERLSSVFWFKGTIPLVANFLAPNEPGKNFTAERYRLMEDQSGLIIYNVTDDDGGLYDCRVVPTATKRERQGLVTVKILYSTFPADADTMDSTHMALLSQNVDRQNGGQIKCPHSTIDAEATYWSLDKGEGVDTDIIGAEYSNKDTLVLDNYKRDYQILNGGDLRLLSLQRPHRRFWCHRFLNGLAVGRVDVTGVVSTNQDQPIITGCEPLPGDGCQVNFNPDKDLQLKCSVLNVYPRVTLYWNDISKCDINFNEESLESFDDDAKTFNQYQQLTVKAGSFSDDCLPKFVCNATGAAIPVQPFGAEVALQVVSGAYWVIGLIVGVIVLVLICLIVFLVKRRSNHSKTSATHVDSNANASTANVIELADTDGQHSPQGADESQTLLPQTSQSGEDQPEGSGADESQTLLPQTSQSGEDQPEGSGADESQTLPPQTSQSEEHQPEGSGPKSGSDTMVVNNFIVSNNHYNSPAKNGARDDNQQSKAPEPSPAHYPSPLTITINQWFDYTPGTSIPKSFLSPSRHADQDSHARAHVRPQSDYLEPTPGVGLESNASRYPNRIPSDDKSMVSESESGNEVADDTPHNGVTDDVGYDQPHKAPSLEIDEVLADDIPQDESRTTRNRTSQSEELGLVEEGPKSGSDKTVVNNYIVNIHHYYNIPAKTDALTGASSETQTTTALGGTSSQTPQKGARDDKQQSKAPELSPAHYPSPGSNTFNILLDNTLKTGITQPSLPLSPHADPDDEDMVSESQSGMEKEDDTHHDVSDDVGYDQDHELPQ